MPAGITGAPGLPAPVPAATGAAGAPIPGGGTIIAPGAAEAPALLAAPAAPELALTPPGDTPAAPSPAEGAVPSASPAVGAAAPAWLEAAVADPVPVAGGSELSADPAFDPAERPCEKAPADVAACGAAAEALLGSPPKPSRLGTWKPTGRQARQAATRTQTTQVHHRTPSS